MNADLATTIPPDVIRNAGEPVFPELRLRLGLSSRVRLDALIDAREAYGVAKYGQTLLTDDSRDTPTEIANELLDALAYLTKWYMQHRDSHVFVRMTIDEAIRDTASILRNVIALAHEMEEVKP